MKKLVCAMLLILSAGYADYKELMALEIDCRDFKNMTACKKWIFVNQMLCNKDGVEVACFNLGMAYGTSHYGIAPNYGMALLYVKPPCDKGWNESATCAQTALLYGVIGYYKMSDIYIKKACDAGNEEVCQTKFRKP